MPYPIKTKFWFLDPFGFQNFEYPIVDLYYHSLIIKCFSMLLTTRMAFYVHNALTNWIFFSKA